MPKPQKPPKDDENGRKGLTCTDQTTPPPAPPPAGQLVPNIAESASSTSSLQLASSICPFPIYLTMACEIGGEKGLTTVHLEEIIDDESRIANTCRSHM